MAVKKDGESRWQPKGRTMEKNLILCWNYGSDERLKVLRDTVQRLGLYRKLDRCVLLIVEDEALSKRIKDQLVASGVSTRLVGRGELVDVQKDQVAIYMGKSLDLLRLDLVSEERTTLVVFIEMHAALDSLIPSYRMLVQECVESQAQRKRSTAFRNLHILGMTNLMDIESLANRENGPSKVARTAMSLLNDIERCADGVMEYRNDVEETWNTGEDLSVLPDRQFFVPYVTETSNPESLCELSDELKSLDVELWNVLRTSSLQRKQEGRITGVEDEGIDQMALYVENELGPWVSNGLMSIAKGNPVQLAMRPSSLGHKAKALLQIMYHEIRSTNHSVIELYVYSKSLCVLWGIREMLSSISTTFRTGKFVVETEPEGLHYLSFAQRRISLDPVTPGNPSNSVGTVKIVLEKGILTPKTIGQVRAYFFEPFSASRKRGLDGSDGDSPTKKPKNALLSLDPDQLLRNEDFKGNDLVLKSKTTDARLVATDCIAIVHQYCKLIATAKDGMEMPQCEYTQGTIGEFYCTMTLPAKSPVKELRGKGCSSKKRAKASAAFNLCTILYDKNILDDYLQPISTEPKVQKRSKAAKEQEKAERQINVRVEAPPSLQWDDEAMDDFGGIVMEFQDACLYRIDDKIPENEVELLREWGMSDYGLLLRRSLAEEDLPAIEMPHGRPLLDLIPLRRVSLSLTELEELREYCIRIHGLANNSVKSTILGESVQWSHPEYLFVPLTGKHGIDWISIRALNEFSFDADLSEGSRTQLSDFPMLAKSPVLANTDRGRRVYFADRLSIQASDEVASFTQENIKSYLEKNEIPLYHNDESVLEVYFNNPLTHIREDGSVKKLRKVILMPELCSKLPVEVYALRLLRKLPYWERFISVQSLRRVIDPTMQTNSLSFGRALTPRRAGESEEWNYERLEFLGDSILKAITSVWTFKAFPDEEEGKLTAYREDVITNAALCNMGKKIKLPSTLVLTTTPAILKLWPFRFASVAEGKKLFPMSVKLQGDCIEAIVGLLYEVGGFPLAGKVLTELGAKQKTKEGGKNLAERRLEPSKDPRLQSDVVSQIEKILNYKFKNKMLVLEALTHPSYKLEGPVRSYQRLEFLGDGVLNCELLKYIYFKYTNLQPRELSLLCNVAYSNELFARAVVRSGLHAHIFSASTHIDEEVKRFLEELELFNPISAGSNAPKHLADVLEALAGAVMLDCGNDMDVVRKVFFPLLQDFLDKLVVHGKVQVPAFERLNKWAIRKKKRISVEVRLIRSSQAATQELSSSQATQLYRCRVSLDGDLVTEQIADSKKAAKHNAAEATLEYVKEKFGFADFEAKPQPDPLDKDGSLESSIESALSSEDSQKPQDTPIEDESNPLQEKSSKPGNGKEEPLSLPQLERDATARSTNHNNSVCATPHKVSNPPEQRGPTENADRTGEAGESHLVVKNQHRRESSPASRLMLSKCLKEEAESEGIAADLPVDNGTRSTSSTGSKVKPGFPGQDKTREGIVLDGRKSALRWKDEENDGSETNNTVEQDADENDDDLVSLARLSTGLEKWSHPLKARGGEKQLPDSTKSVSWQPGEQASGRNAYPFSDVEGESDDLAAIVRVQSTKKAVEADQSNRSLAEDPWEERGPARKQATDEITLIQRADRGSNSLELVGSMIEEGSGVNTKELPNTWRIDPANISEVHVNTGSQKGESSDEDDFSVLVRGTNLAEDHTRNSFDNPEEGTHTVLEKGENAEGVESSQARDSLLGGAVSEPPAALTNTISRKHFVGGPNVHAATQALEDSACATGIDGSFDNCDELQTRAEEMLPLTVMAPAVPQGPPNDMPRTRSPGGPRVVVEFDDPVSQETASANDVVPTLRSEPTLSANAETLHKFLLECPRPQHLGEEARDAEAEKVRGTETERVGGTEAAKVGGTEAEEIRRTEREEIRGAEAGEIRGAEREEIQGTEAGAIRGTEREEIRGTEREEIRGTEREEIRGTELEETRDTEGEEIRGTEGERQAAQPSSGEERRAKVQPHDLDLPDETIPDLDLNVSSDDGGLLSWLYEDEVANVDPVSEGAGLDEESEGLVHSDYSQGQIAEDSIPDLGPSGATQTAKNNFYRSDDESLPDIVRKKPAEAPFVAEKEPQELAKGLANRTRRGEKAGAERIARNRSAPGRADASTSAGVTVTRERYRRDSTPPRPRKSGPFTNENPENNDSSNPLTSPNGRPCVPKTWPPKPSQWKKPLKSGSLPAPNRASQRILSKNGFGKPLLRDQPRKLGPKSAHRPRRETSPEAYRRHDGSRESSPERSRRRKEKRNYSAPEKHRRFSRSSESLERSRRKSRRRTRHSSWSDSESLSNSSLERRRTRKMRKRKRHDESLSLSSDTLSSSALESEIRRLRRHTRRRRDKRRRARRARRAAELEKSSDSSYSDSGWRERWRPERRELASEKQPASNPRGKTMTRASGLELNKKKRAVASPEKTTRVDTKKTETASKINHGRIATQNKKADAVPEVKTNTTTKEPDAARKGAKGRIETAEVRPRNGPTNNVKGQAARKASIGTSSVNGVAAKVKATSDGPEPSTQAEQSKKGIPQNQIKGGKPAPDEEVERAEAPIGKLAVSLTPRVAGDAANSERAKGDPRETSAFASLHVEGNTWPTKRKRVDYDWGTNPTWTFDRNSSAFRIQTEAVESCTPSNEAGRMERTALTKQRSSGKPGNSKITISWETPGRDQNAQASKTAASSTPVPRSQWSQKQTSTGTVSTKSVPGNKPLGQFNRVSRNEEHVLTSDIQSVQKLRNRIAVEDGAHSKPRSNAVAFSRDTEERSLQQAVRREARHLAPAQVDTEKEVEAVEPAEGRLERLGTASSAVKRPRTSQRESRLPDKVPMVSTKKLVSSQTGNGDRKADERTVGNSREIQRFSTPTLLRTEHVATADAPSRPKVAADKGRPFPAIGKNQPEREAVRTRKSTVGNGYTSTQVEERPRESDPTGSHQVRNMERVGRVSDRIVHEPDRRREGRQSEKAASGIATSARYATGRVQNREMLTNYQGVKPHNQERTRDDDGHNSTLTINQNGQPGARLSHNLKSGRNRESRVTTEGQSETDLLERHILIPQPSGLSGRNNDESLLEEGSRDVNYAETVRRQGTYQRTGGRDVQSGAWQVRNQAGQERVQDGFSHYSRENAPASASTVPSYRPIYQSPANSAATRRRQSNPAFLVEPRPTQARPRPNNSPIAPRREQRSNPSIRQEVLIILD